MKLTQLTCVVCKMTCNYTVWLSGEGWCSNSIYWQIDPWFFLCVFIKMTTYISWWLLIFFVIYASGKISVLYLQRRIINASMFHGIWIRNLSVFTGLTILDVESRHSYRCHVFSSAWTWCWLPEQKNTVRDKANVIISNKLLLIKCLTQLEKHLLSFFLKGQKRLITVCELSQWKFGNSNIWRFFLKIKHLFFLVNP